MKTQQAQHILEAMSESDIKQFSKNLRDITLLQCSKEGAIDDPEFYVTMIMLFDLLDSIVEDKNNNTTV